MREDFAAQLIALETRLLWELHAVAELLDQVADAVADPSDEQTYKRMRTAAARLREVSREVDAELVTVAARQAPVASDLRVVLALLQLGHHGLLIANQLELIADQLREIDPLVLDRQHTSQQAALMTTLAGKQLGRALQAFAARDLDAARQIQREDDALDRINRQVCGATVELSAAPDEREVALRYVLVARSLERIGDNAVDIAEQTDFLITAQLHEFTDASSPKRPPQPA
jgi:phosphate transport system protein